MGDWPYPPAAIGEQPETRIRVTTGDGHLVVHHPLQGTSKLCLQPDGSFHMEDALERWVPVRNRDGSLAGLVEAGAEYFPRPERPGQAEDLEARLFPAPFPPAALLRSSGVCSGSVRPHTSMRTGIEASGG